jgi:hypothetical protein
LPSKHEALSSNPSTTKKKKKRMVSVSTSRRKKGLDMVVHICNPSKQEAEEGGY